MYHSVSIGAGLNGWDIAEPGRYTVQAMLRHGDEDVVSAPLRLRIAPPRGHEEEFLALRVGRRPVGRTFAFNGTRQLDGANATLREVVDRLPDRRVSDRARVALAAPLTRNYKVLTGTASSRIAVLDPDPREARSLLAAALVDEPRRAADTLGHIEYAEQARQFSAFLADRGDKTEAAQCLQVAKETLEERGVRHPVLADLEERRTAITRKKS